MAIRKEELLFFKLIFGMLQPGGFLVTADDIVQPFHLPSNTHKFALSTDDNQSVNVKRAVTDENSILMEETLPHNLETQDGDGYMVTDDNPVPPNRPIVLVPKTMHELAEHHAHLEKSRKNESSFPGPAEAGPSSISINTRKRTSRSSNSQQPTGDKSSTPISRPKRTRSSRKRIRRPEETDSDDEAKPSPSKRVRGRNSAAVDTAPSPRILRPRAPKSAARAQEEHEMEEAYRQAMEE